MSDLIQQRTRLQLVGLFLGPLLFFVIMSLDLVPGKPIVTSMAAVAVLMATWWMTEAIPLAATAILPMLLFPIMDIMTGKAAAPLYINSTIFLFMGGFMIALAMERWQLHRRIALLVIKTIGGGPSRIVLGFMGASAFLSMWISNTATAVMMLPIGLSIILQMEKEFVREGDAQLLGRPDAGHCLCRFHGRCRNPGGNPPESGASAGFRAQLSRPDPEFPSDCGSSWRCP